MGCGRSPRCASVVNFRAVCRSPAGEDNGWAASGVSGRLVGPSVFKTAERLYQQPLVGSIPIHSRFPAPRPPPGLLIFTTTTEPHTLFGELLTGMLSMESSRPRLLVG